MCEIKSVRIKNFLNKDVKEFAQYVLETRALPNIMDGLRIGARKILWAGHKGDLSKKNSIKLPALIGDTLKMGYHHGDASLANTIVTLSLLHNNKYSPLEVIGQTPSLRVPNVDVATRYLSVKRSKYFDWFLADKELLHIQEEEGELIEPKYFLPIVPFVLLNRTNSPGFGFSFKSKAYNIHTIIDNLLLAIRDGSCQISTESIQLIPEIDGIKQENIIFNSDKNRWYNVGEYVLDTDNGILTVKDLPYDVSFDTFEENLKLLQEKGEIKSFSNFSQGDTIKYIINFEKTKLLSEIRNQFKFFKKFKLFSILPEDILNCIDQDGKSILFFNDAYELIDSFVKKRLKYYNERKIRTIKHLEEKIQELTYRITFIEKVINGEIVVVEQKKDVIKKQLVQHKIPDFVMDMKIWNLTEEEITNLRNKIKEYQEQLDYIKRTTIEEMYTFDLIELKKQLNSIKSINAIQTVTETI